MIAWLYGLLAASIIILDQLTKYLALRWCALACTFNRGISWGMLNSGSPLTFYVLTGLVIAITVILAGYAYHRMQQGYTVFGELLIVSGSVSNIIDRFIYGGVVDFIEVRVGSWIGPSFNLADSMIVLGVGIMAFGLLFSKRCCE
jgi:signal peptidase II